MSKIEPGKIRYERAINHRKTGPDEMNFPARYEEWIVTLPSLEISLGCGGIKLLPASDLQEGQVGYSVDPDGKRLSGDAAGHWRSSWLVIGYDTGLGDPIFADTSAPLLPVFTAMQGEGTWNPKPIATSMEAFRKILLEFGRISESRQTPAAAERNQLTLAQREAFLEQVAQINEGQIEPEFWEAMFAYLEE